MTALEVIYLIVWSMFCLLMGMKLERWGSRRYSKEQPNG